MRQLICVKIINNCECLCSSSNVDSMNNSAVQTIVDNVRNKKLKLFYIRQACEDVVILEKSSTENVCLYLTLQKLLIDKKLK